MEQRELPSLKVDLAYAMINVGSAAIWSILNWWLAYFYLPPAGEGVPRVPVAGYGAVVFLAGAFNAFLALPVGYWSDQRRSRLGRRLPLIFGSALPLLIFFVLLWTPPLPGTSLWNLGYLALVLLLYNAAYVFNQIPYTALLPELALSDAHRVRISAWSAGAMLVGTILSGFAGFLIERYGYLGMALVYAVGSLPLFYLPLLVLRERPDRWQDTPRLDLREAGRALWRNRPFRIMTVTGLCYWGITTLMMATIPYLATEICLVEQADTWLFYTPAILATLLCYPLVTWAAGRWGKWRVFAASLLASTFVLPGIAFIGERWPLSPELQGILWVTLQAVALSGVTMLPPAFGAEIVDYDERLTGQRREGTYYGIWSLLGQLTGSAAMGLWSLLLLLGRSRTDPHGPLGVRMAGVVSGALMLVGFLVFLHYPLRDGEAVEEVGDA